MQKRKGTHNVCMMNANHMMDSHHMMDTHHQLLIIWWARHTSYDEDPSYDNVYIHWLTWSPEPPWPPGQPWPHGPHWQPGPPVVHLDHQINLNTGVSILRYISISILIKYSNFSRFYKKLGSFYKNSDVISLVIDQSQPKLHWTIRYKALWKYICI